jgi:hypothetical protein
MVHAVSAAVHTVDLNAADHRLDIEDYTYLLCVPSPNAWTALVSSELIFAAGI